MVGVRGKDRIEYVVDRDFAKEVLVNSAAFSFEDGTAAVSLDFATLGNVTYPY